MNPGNEVAIRISINYIVPLWDRSVPGKCELGFAGLADLQNPLHKWHGFKIFAHTAPGAFGVTRRFLVSALQRYRI